MQEGGAGDAHMDFLGAGGVEASDLVAQLGTSDDGVVAENEAFAFDEFGDGDEFHAGDVLPEGLVGGHKAAGPGGGVLDEGAFVGDAGLCGVSEGVADARVGDACNAIGIDGVAARQALHLGQIELQRPFTGEKLCFISEKFDFTIRTLLNSESLSETAHIASGSRSRAISIPFSESFFAIS